MMIRSLRLIECFEISYDLIGTCANLPPWVEKSCRKSTFIEFSGGIFRRTIVRLMLTIPLIQKNFILSHCQNYTDAVRNIYLQYTQILNVE